MGTRHLISVVSDGQIKIAQYGQWDGYPTSAGADIQDFLSGANLDTFTDRVNALEWWDGDLVRAVWEQAGSKDGWIAVEDADKVKARYPELSRDTGSNILWLVLSGKVTKVVDDSSFADDDVWCEYHYLLNLDDHTLSLDSFGEHVGVYTFAQWVNMTMAELQEGLE